MTFRNSCNFPPKIKCLICYPITKDIVYSKILLNGNKFEYASEITFRIKVFCMGSGEPAIILLAGSNCNFESEIKL